MLAVSELIEVARGARPPAEVETRSPARFGPPRARRPVVVWNVCRHCNMRCPHCYAAATETPSRHDLDPDAARTLIDRLAEGGVRLLIFSGGEPLLRADVPDLVAHAQRRGLTPHLSTNGSLLDERIARRLAESGLAYAGVSLDGRAAFNDAYRGMPGGFALGVRALRACRAVGIRTGVRLTLTRRNLTDVEPLVEVARRERVDRLYVSHLVYAGRALRLVGDDLSPVESREALLALFELAERLLAEKTPLRIVTGGNDSGGPLLLRWIEGRYGGAAADAVATLLARRGGNSAGEGILAIDPRGRVRPDQFWNGEPVGDLTRQSLAEVMAHPLLATLRARTARLEGRCRNCAYLSLCRGSHRERALASRAGLWGPDPACVLDDAEIGLAAVAQGGGAS
jgi:radical SAM protein with 4Fe4S-binding SPASM domain